MSEPTKITPETAKRRSDFFASVRKRGVLNAMLDGPAKSFEEKNPGWRARWEYCPPSGDKTFIIAREGLGFHIVDASELGETTASGQKDGQIRVGDLILMAAEDFVVEAIEMDDAKAAYGDWKVPEAAYKEQIRGIKPILRDGTEKETVPVGEVRVTQEDIRAPRGVGMDHELETDKD